MGVDLFFVLSGFLITGLLLDSKGKANYFRSFYARRTLRIFPLYYAVLAGVFLVLPLVVPLPPALEQAREHQVWLWTYTANFYIAAKATWALTYVSHFWSLAVEEHFYLVWPLVVFSVRRETLEKICLGVMAIGLVERVSLTFAGVNELSISVLTPCRVDTLCTGALLAVLVRREAGALPLVRQSGKAAVVLGSAALVLGAFNMATHRWLEVLHPVRVTLHALFFGALTLLSLRLPEGSLIARLFRSRVLRTFGKYSYGLYVYHGLIAYHMIELRAEDYLGARLGGHPAGIAAQTVLGVALSMIVSVASYELFERRFLDLKKYFEARPPEPAAAPARGQRSA
jgi:peptidoglycan/LPS O-acetylase OafA/YrhL